MFNLELALFLKTLHLYTVKVNEIDDETTQLLVETILAVNKLQNGSKYRETSFSTQSLFLNELNEEQFICRRHIVCRVCHVSKTNNVREKINYNNYYNYIINTRFVD